MKLRSYLTILGISVGLAFAASSASADGGACTAGEKKSECSSEGAKDCTKDKDKKDCSSECAKECCKDKDKKDCATACTDKEKDT